MEGFKITLVDEADLYNWEVAIFGPPNTHYEGGYFKVRTERGKCVLFLGTDGYGLYIELEPALDSCISFCATLCLFSIEEF